MPVEATFLSAFLVGMFGGVHCFGMCGGIVGALSLGLPEYVRREPMAALPYLLAYNTARILSYTIAGALIGGIGALATNLMALHHARLLLQLVAGAFLLALGLYLGGWWRGLARIEQAGNRIWRHLEPLGRRFLPIRTVPQAFGMGLVWGWLPCGLVYSVLIWAVSAGSAERGALLMLSFGLGTLPVMLAMGFSAAAISTWLRNPFARGLAGAAVAAYGVYLCAVAVAGYLALSVPRG